jgi:hypothetical protein
MDKCTNPKLGNLLHAYELKTLTGADVERFELHILECDYCFNEISSFNDEVSMLLSDNQIKKELENQISPESAQTTIWRLLWPNRTPLVLRPAFIYSAAALLILVWLGSSILNVPDKIRTVQSIGFYQTRSGKPNVFYKAKSRDAFINFMVKNYDGKSGVVVNILDQRENLVYHNEQFDDIDVNGLGRLYLSLADLEKGEYSLELKMPENIPPFNRIVYSFEIK